MTTTIPEPRPAALSEAALEGDSGPWGARRFERTVAILAVVLVALQRITVGPDLMPRHAVAIALLPVWLFALREWRGARLLFGIGLVSVGAGLVLTLSAGADLDVSTTAVLKQVNLVGGVITGIGVILWTRRILGVRSVALYFALGLLLNGLISVGALGAANPFKFAFALPIAIGLLTLLSHRPRGLQLLVLLGLSGLASISDARSLFGICLAAAAVVAWQMRPITSSRAGSWWSTAIVVAVIGGVLYNVVSALLVGGFLGAEAQQRSSAQLGAAGSLILGGRPEIAATAALMRMHPFGFGYGVSVGHSELQAAKSGMAAINYNPDNGYVERYMFGNNVIELHSVLGDLWAASGLVGIALALLMLWQVGRNISQQIAARTANGLVLFLAALTAWNMFFSPLYSAAPSLILAFGLLLPDRLAATAGAGNQRPASTLAQP